MTPKSEFLEARDLRFHYRDWGGTGKPLVLLHGLASNARIWDLTAPLLTGGFRVVALDQRGHGLSDKPDGGYDFASITGDLAAFLQALGLERPALAGHSWGANVALQFAADHPEGVSALALVDGGFLEISAIEGMTWEGTVAVMSPPPLAGMKLDAFLQGARNWPGLGEFWSDDVQEIVLANFRIDDDKTIHPHLSRDNHLRILRSLWEQKPSALWSHVCCPTLLVPSTRDHPDPRNAAWLAHKRKGIALAEERAPSLEVFWMDDTIHDVPLQRPQELAGAIGSFLESLA